MGSPQGGEPEDDVKSVFTTARIALANFSDENFATYASASALLTCSSLVVADSDE